MQNEIILIISIQHSGSCFVRTLLSRHSAISRPLTFGQLLEIEECNVLIQRFGQYDCINGNNLSKALQLVAVSDNKYVQLNIYIHEYWALPMLLHKDIDAKIIITMRHPLNVLKSVYWRKELLSQQLMNQYNILLYIAKIYPEAFILNVDTLSTKSQAARLESMKKLFEGYLDLEITSQLEKKIIEWNRVNFVWDKDRVTVPKEILKQMFKRIESSGVFDKMNDLNIDYSHIDIL
jgi:hypothetical protein